MLNNMVADMIAMKVEMSTKQREYDLKRQAIEKVREQLREAWQCDRSACV